MSFKIKKSDSPRVEKFARTKRKTVDQTLINNAGFVQSCYPLLARWRSNLSAINQTVLPFINVDVFFFELDNKGRNGEMWQSCVFIS